MSRLARTDEQRMLADTVARFVDDAYPFERRGDVIDSPAGFSEVHWRRFAELGWLALPLAEAQGGLGGNLADVAVIAEGFGRGLVATPYLSSVVLAAQAIRAAGDERQCAALLPPVADGASRPTLAHVEPGRDRAVGAIETRATAGPGGYRLDGAKTAVLYAETADRLIVSARVDGGAASLFVVDPGGEGVRARHDRTHDGGRMSEIDLDGAVVAEDARLRGNVDVVAVLEAVYDGAAAIACAEAVGIVWAVYEQTLEYLKTRRQFGAAIGSFQALQHRMADVYMLCELATSISIDACAALEAPAVERARRVSAAKNAVGRYGMQVGREGIQLHGGIGMTRELAVGHCLKRLTAIDLLFGSRAWHLERHRRLDTPPPV